MINAILAREGVLDAFGHVSIRNPADPSRFYDLSTYNAELLKLIGPGYPWQNWPNPPTALVVMAPFGLLTYFPGLIAWSVVSFLAFYLAGRREVADARVLLVVRIQLPTAGAHRSDHVFVVGLGHLALASFDHFGEAPHAQELPISEYGLEHVFLCWNRIFANGSVVTIGVLQGQTPGL